MNDHPRNFSDALKLAITFEKEGREYYLSALDKCNHPLGKRMLQSLANDEIIHMQRITKLFDSLVDKGEWPEDLPLPQSQIKTTFKEAMETIDKDLKGDETDLGIIEQALKLEKRGYEFYRSMAQKSTSQNEISFFNFLAGEESMHIDVLQTTYEYFEKPWEFFAGEEHPIFEG